MGKYKHGKPNAEIELNDVQRALDKSRLPLHKRTYVILLYWVGCRRSEPLLAKTRTGTVFSEGVKKEDVHVHEDSLWITIPAFKGGQRGGAIELPLSYFGVDLIRKVWERTKPKRRLWNFSSSTGYRVIKQLFPKKSPHWLRHNRITKIRKLIDGKTVSLDDAKSFTGIKSDRTMQTYGMKTQEGIHRVAKVLQ